MLDQTPLFPHDPSTVEHQVNSTSCYLTALDQVPRFFHDPSGILVQQDSPWLSLNSRGHLSTVSKSYGLFTTQLQNKEQSALASVQSPMFSQDSRTTGQRSTADYQQSFTPREGLEQAVMFSRDHCELSEHDSRINSLLTAPVHDSTCFPHSDVILMYQDGICYSTVTSMQASVFSQDPGGVRAMCTAQPT